MDKTGCTVREHTCENCAERNRTQVLGGNQSKDTTGRGGGGGSGHMRKQRGQNGAARLAGTAAPRKGGEGETEASRVGGGGAFGYKPGRAGGGRRGLRSSRGTGGTQLVSTKQPASTAAAWQARRARQQCPGLNLAAAASGHSAAQRSSPDGCAARAGGVRGGDESRWGGAKLAAPRRGGGAAGSSSSRDAEGSAHESPAVGTRCCPPRWHKRAGNWKHEGCDREGGSL